MGFLPKQTEKKTALKINLRQEIYKERIIRQYACFGLRLYPYRAAHKFNEEKEREILIITNNYENFTKLLRKSLNINV